MTSPHDDPIEQASPRLAAALREVAGATAAIVAATLPPGSSSRTAAERLGVSKFTSWLLLALVRATSPGEMAKARPGTRGWASLLRGFDAVGAPPALLAALRESVARLQAAIEAEREEFDLDALIAGRLPRAGTTTNRGRLLRRAHFESRKTAAAAVHAKVGIDLVTPNRRDASRVDVTRLQLFDGLERLVPGGLRQLAAVHSTDEHLRAWMPEGADLREALGRQGPLPPLLEELSSPGMVGVELHASKSGADGSGDAGGAGVWFSQRHPARRGRITLAFGEWIPALGAVYAEAGERDEACLRMGVSGWAEYAVLDVLWHRDLPAGGSFSAKCVPPSNAPIQGSWASVSELEVTARVESDARPELPAPLRSASVAYRRLLRRGLEHLGETYEAFEHWRYFVECPPLRSGLILWRPMAQRGSAPVG
ncbi:MAG: hypothetical protein FJ257_03540 [Phycisphaerae bacterium]|nr:hypothetical protein [Phycisphaerae bacterium]